jgi:hypothetical protein
MDRTPRKVGKETQSVYRHCKSKGESLEAVEGIQFDLSCIVPSQASIYQHMLLQESMFSTTTVPQSTIAAFLNEGLGILDAQ